MAIFGAFIGLVVAGAAFVLPRIISQAIIEPAGGVAIVTEGQISCDELLREQLVAQRGANNGSRMNEVIQLIQTRQECSPEVWDVRSHTVNPHNGWAASSSNDERSDCFADMTTATGVSATIGGVVVPIGLRKNNDQAAEVRRASYRDANNNILLLFLQDGPDGTGHITKYPADGAVCWLYVSRLRQWYTAFGP